MADHDKQDDTDGEAHEPAAKESSAGNSGNGDGGAAPSAKLAVAGHDGGHGAAATGHDDHGLAHTTFGPAEKLSPGRRRKDDRRWITREAAPWVGRRLRGRSRGDDMAPRFPEWVEVVPPR